MADSGACHFSCSGKHLWMPPQLCDRGSLLLQFHGRDGLGDVPDVQPSADSITLQPQEGALCTFSSLLPARIAGPHQPDRIRM